MPRRAIECFHLLLCHRLTAKVDKTLFCLKGGCNLRFYFRSIRYSEDIDFDVHKVSVETLRKNVDKILEDAAFRSVLKRTILQHSLPEKAIEQKIGALIHRTETQARDVIDLRILKDHLGSAPRPSLASAEKMKALETLMSVSFEDFKSQVWPYLMEEYQDHYGQQAIWDQLQNDVITFIENLPETP